jgi:hypothetical protein
MRIKLWCCGFLWLLFSVTSSWAQSPSVTDDDVVIDVPAVQNNLTIQITQATFDSLTKGPNLDAGSVQRSRIENCMVRRLEALQKQCTLTDDQIAKLKLAIQCETWRLLQDHAAIHAKYVGRTISRDDYTAAYMEIFQTITIPFADPCRPDSLFHKVFRRHASPEQWERFQELNRSEIAAEWRESLSPLFGGRGSLTNDQLDKITEHCMAKYPHWRPLPKTFTYSRYLTLLVVDEQKDQIKPLVMPDQWANLEKQLVTARQVEPGMRRLGLWPLPAE